MVRSLSYAEMKVMAEKALTMANQEEVLTLVKSTLKVD